MKNIRVQVRVQPGSPWLILCISQHMPEGPTIVILKEQVQKFAGKKILAVDGNTKVDLAGVAGSKVVEFRSWGKHFLIVLPKCTIRIHFMLFGSYSIDEQTKPNPRLHLKFKTGDLYFYACSVKVLPGEVDEHYDWSGDVMNDAWDPAKARKKLKAKPEELAADALLDQDIFAGVGNIIKNEVLFRIRVHPESRIGGAPPTEAERTYFSEACNYSFDFPTWKKAFKLRETLAGACQKYLPTRSHPLRQGQTPG